MVKPFTGRLNRINFFVGLLIVFCILPIVFIPTDASGGFWWVFLILFLYLTTSLFIRRLHDINKNGYLLLLIFIPIANIAIPIWIAGTKGDTGDNKYGSPDNGFNIKKILTL